jgi:stage III sporulation protein AE
MQSLIPILLTLMAALGSLTTVALMHPVIYVSLNIIATLIQNIVFPLIFCAAILGIVSSLSERFQVSRLADLFRDGSMLLTGLLLTIFTGILGSSGGSRSGYRWGWDAHNKISDRCCCPCSRGCSYRCRRCCCRLFTLY